MELNHLKYFFHVAREGGFSKAARSLHIAQPAVTRMVKNLEASLGYELFERSGRNVRLTKVGNDLYRKCEIIFGHVEEIRALNDRVPALLSGPLNIGAAEPVANYLVPGVIKNFRHQHPGVYPQITVGTAAETVRLVASGKLHAAILFHAPELPAALEVRTLLPVVYKLVVASKHRRNKDVCAAFIGSREVDDTANKTYPTLAKLRRKYPEAEIRISTNSLTAHRQMVADGLGVSILPEFMIRQDLKSKRFACLLADQDFCFNMKVIAARGAPLSSAAVLFVKELARQIN